MNEDNNDSIRRVEKRLYRSEPGDLERQRSPLSEPRFDANKDWQNQEAPRKEISILTVLLVVSALFFVGAGLFSLFLYFGGINVASNQNVEITLAGPVSVKGGEEFNLQIMVGNKNTNAMEFTDLIVYYPEGTKIISTDGKKSSVYRKSLGTIGGNEIVKETVKAVLYGEEGGEKEVKVEVEYRNENSNAILVKSQTWKTIINASPVALDVIMPDDVNANQEISLDIKVKSNSTEVLEDVYIIAAYPPGFVFKSSAPKPISDDNDIWGLGDIPVGGERLVNVKGVVKGQNDEEKTFKVSTGIMEKGATGLSVLYDSFVKSILIRKPYIGLNLTLNGSAENPYIGVGGQAVRADVEWLNNLPGKLLDGEITVKINGDIVNKSTINTGGGFYNSLENTITWNKKFGSIPSSMDPGYGDRKSFSFTPISLLSGRGAGVKNPEFDLEVKFKGTRFAEDTQEGPVESSIVKKIKLSSDIQVAPVSYYRSGPFKNTGPLPPIHEQETSYTIVWSIVNSSNDMHGVVVRSTLPPYVKWLNMVSPFGENISYNPLGGEIVWNVGDVKAGSGITSPARELAFQVGFMPSLSHVGGFPELVFDSTISGTDDFTGAKVSYTRRAVTTQLSADPLVSTMELGAVK